MFVFAYSACSLVTVIALLLIVFCGMLFHPMSLELLGSGALVVAGFTGKGLLSSVRSRVFF